MEKQLSLIGYWLGLTCTVLALILRMLAALKMLPSPLWCSRWHRHFLHEFPSRCRAVFLAYDRELVPDAKVPVLCQDYVMTNENSGSPQPTIREAFFVLDSTSMATTPQLRRDHEV